MIDIVICEAEYVLVDNLLNDNVIKMYLTIVLWYSRPGIYMTLAVECGVLSNPEIQSIQVFVAFAIAT